MSIALRLQTPNSIHLLMTTHHKQVPLSDATAGMLLWDAVVDERGNVLLPAGTVLTTPMLVSLARHQIEMLAIAGPALSAAEELARSSQLTARIAWLFRTPGNARGTVKAPATAAADSATQHDPGATATDVLHQYVSNFRADTLP